MRIISGQYKGRRLRAPKQLPVRPTTDMAKEALFNILTHRYDFEQIEVLDLFSGTGNISYEFCSRGTSAIQAVDKNRRCVKFIQQTVDNLNMQVQVLNLDVFSFLVKTTKSYDVIFADPPYDHQEFPKLAELILDSNIFEESGILIYEHHKNYELPEKFKNLKKVRNKKYGDSRISIYKRQVIDD